MQLDTILLAIDKFDLDSLINKETFFDNYLFEDDKGYISLESAYLNSFDSIKTLIKFLFHSDTPPNEIYKRNSSTIFDLTDLKSTIATFEELENYYPSWLEETGRDNTMDEYGMLTGFVGYAQRNVDKKYFILMVDQE